MSWNLHGKSLEALADLMTGTCTPPDVLMLQELGGIRDLELGAQRVQEWSLGPKTYNVYVVNTTASFRCVAVAVCTALIHARPEVVPHPLGLLVKLASDRGHFCLSSLHFPHEQRADAVEVWTTGIQSLQVQLSALSQHTQIVLGCDLNQNYASQVDSFPGMSHMRSLVHVHGLRGSAPLGGTWHARGLSTPIDWWLFRTHGCQAQFWKDEGMRQALPSDHDPIFLQITVSAHWFQRTWRPQDKTGQWNYRSEIREQGLRDPEFIYNQDSISELCQKAATRPPNLRYSDSPRIQELIAERKSCMCPEKRALLMKQIRETRTADKAQHKTDLLQRARQGDRRAISFLRRSAAGASFEGGYVAARGGLQQAAEELADFYRHKYAREDAEPDPVRVHAASVAPPPAPITHEDLVACIQEMKRGVSGGLDGVTYEGLLQIALMDTQHKLAGYLTDILQGRLALPSSWSHGKITLMPKVSQPQGAKDLRPICLTPCLGKVFSKILMRRVRDASPPYQAGQMGCRPGSQAIDGVAAAQMIVQQLRSRGRCGACVAKLDIRAAFDTLSHSAILEWLRQGRPTTEKVLLWEMCIQSRITMGIGARRWDQQLERGVLQGTSYSADLFSRVIDWFLGPLIEHWRTERFPDWEARVGPLAHLLLYADDLLVFADTPADLQTKVQGIEDCLAAIGLRINASKSTVLGQVQGPAPGVWLRGQPQPMPAEDHLLYLGVPLSYILDTEVMIGHGLRKTFNTYYAFRRLLQGIHTPLKLKMLLFDSYITSKWAWCAPVLWPSAKLLRRLTALQHTYLLGVLAFTSDFVLGWLGNEIAKRRAVREVCDRLLQGRAKWAEIWVRRVWRYWGHLSRSEMNTPVVSMFRTCYWAAVATGATRPVWVQDTVPRRLQRAYMRFRKDAWPAAWELLAHRRPDWTLAEDVWSRYWIAESPALGHPDMLGGRQLLLLGDLSAILRPSKMPPELPYARAVVCVPYYASSARRDKWVIWLVDGKAAVTAAICPPGGGPDTHTWMQMRSPSPQASAADSMARKWRFLRTCRGALPGDAAAVLALPSTLFVRHVLEHHVGLTDWTHVMSIERLHVQLPWLLDECTLQPKKTPKDFQLVCEQAAQSFPPGRQFLLRDASGSTAQFF
ncbi:pol [Symbiodinium natans]|uniref:Pol protein n=1 Tax=Symbiodinium natans TaxID=878477 RepID=A0A812NX75_9DINO|nr:pol [Symbiodinium natans]